MFQPHSWLGQVAHLCPLRHVQSLVPYSKARGGGVPQWGQQYTIHTLNFTVTLSAGNTETVGSSSKKKPEKPNCSCGNSSVSASERWNSAAHFCLQNSKCCLSNCVSNASFLHFLLLIYLGFFFPLVFLKWITCLAILLMELPKVL